MAEPPNHYEDIHKGTVFTQLYIILEYFGGETEQAATMATWT